MKLKADEKKGALYLRLNDATIVDSEMFRADVVLDYDKKAHVVGVELLNIKKRKKLNEATRELLCIPGLLADVRKARREIAAGKGVPWRKVLKERRR